MDLVEGRHYEHCLFNILQKTEDTEGGVPAFAEDQEPK